MQTSSETDAALVDATRRGDHAAFARLIERYQRPVYAVAFSRVRDRALADDLTQDTFVLAWRRLAELRDPTRLPAWLCGIARNLARDARKRQRRDHVGERLDRGRGDRARDIADLATTTPFEALDDAQCDRIVAAALAEVPETYREPLVLYYFEDHSVDDVARALGISAETTHRRLSRGRKYLAERTHQLVEQRMPRRGPSAGLVAGVLAVIGALAAGSHASASPPKGFVMSKLVLVTVVIVTLGAAGMLAVGGPRTSPRTPATNATASTPPVTAKAPVKLGAPASAPLVVLPPTAMPSAAGSHAGTTTSSRFEPSLPAASTIVVPDCAAVGQHMAGLAIARLEGKPVPGPKLTTIENWLVQSKSRKCRDEGWSETMRLCIVDADDEKGATRDCSDEPGATPSELVGLPPELGCKVLAKHAYDLASAPDAKFGIIRKKLASSSPEKVADLDRLIATARDELATECDERPWTVAKRRCVAAAKTQQDYASCR